MEQSTLEKVNMTLNTIREAMDSPLKKSEDSEDWIERVVDCMGQNEL